MNAIGKNKILTKLFKFSPFLLVLLIGGAIFNKYRVPPRLETVDLSLLQADGTPVNYSQFKGKYLFVNYFQSWCGPCIAEMPVIAELQLKYPSLQCIAVSDESFDKIHKVMSYARNEISFYQSTKALKDMGVHTYPTTYLYDPEGNLVFSTVEVRDWLNDKDFISALKL